MHHLRHGDAPEWEGFPQAVEGSSLTLRFAAKAVDAESTLRLRQKDIKQRWSLRLNDKPIGTLPQDENEMVMHWPIPPGALRDEINELRIACDEGPPDDVLVGDVEWIDRPRKQVLTDATLDVAVEEAGGGAGLPCRITIVDSIGGLIELGAASNERLAVRPGVVYTSDGRATINLPAGDYRVYAGRGFEYSVDSAAVALRHGETVERRLKIRRVVPTGGYVACDAHVHTLTYSKHGDATVQERMLTLAGEGIEAPIATEHNLQVDYAPIAERMDVRRWFTPIVGNEVTTPSLGHFNVLPIPAGAPLIEWRGRDWNDVRRSAAATAPNAVVVLNHARDIHGGFRPFDPRRHLSFTGQERDGPSPPANAMEIVNSGSVQNDPMELLRDWFGMLNQGVKLTPIGASDSHDVSRYIVGQARTYVRCEDVDPSRINVERLRQSMIEGRVLVSDGLLVTLKVDDQFFPGDVAAPKGDLHVVVEVFGPAWTKASHLALHANGMIVKETDIQTPPGQPEPEGLKRRMEWTLPRPQRDFYLAAIATGPAVTQPFWAMAKPYQPTSPRWIARSIASTGAVWVDGDGDGRFQCAHDYASTVVEAAGGDLNAVVAALADYDAPTAAQAASILNERSPQELSASWGRAVQDAPQFVREGFERFMWEWNAGKAAK